MRLFLDTNVFIAAVTNEPNTGSVAVDVLDRDHDFLTSTLNLMELRSVLTKKQRLELSEAEAIQDEITTDVQVVIPDASDVSYHALKGVAFSMDSRSNPSKG